MSTTATALPTATWNIDPVHSTIGFAVKHLGISTYRGSFPGASGRIETSNGAISAITGTVEIGSVTTQDANLTGHLLTPDFFDAATFPQATFASTAIVAGDDGALTITGDLTLRGVTQSVTLVGEIEGQGSDPYGNERLGIAAKGKIDRTAFGISWNAPLAIGALAVAEKVTMVLAVAAIAEAAA